MSRTCNPQRPVAAAPKFDHVAWARTPPDKRGNGRKCIACSIPGMDPMIRDIMDMKGRGESHKTIREIWTIAREHFGYPASQAAFSAHIREHVTGSGASSSNE